jgi:anti-sigma factor RsiW
VALHQEFAGQAALYVVGALTAAERSAFEAHLSACAACTAEVRQFAPVIEALASATPSTAPESRVRLALLARIRIAN